MNLLIKIGLVVGGIVVGSVLLWLIFRLASAAILKSIEEYRRRMNDESNSD